MLTHKELKSRALARTDVKAEYDRLDEEFAHTQPDARKNCAPVSLALRL